MNATSALRKKGAPQWWLVDFREETLSICGIQLAASSDLGVLLDCQCPWKVVAICYAKWKLFFF